MALNGGVLPLSSTNLAAGVAAGTSVNPPVSRPQLQNGALLNINSESSSMNATAKQVLTITTDPIKKSMEFLDPAAAPNGTICIYQFRTRTWCQINETMFSIPIQFTMTDGSGSPLSTANAQGVINSMYTAGYNFNTFGLDYAFNKPSCEWFQMFQTLQCRAGSVSTNVQNYSNDVYPNIMTNAYVPKQQSNGLNEVLNNYIGRNMLNSRNGNASSIAPTSPWTTSLPTDTEIIPSQMLQQKFLTDNDPKVSDCLLMDIFKSIITNSPMEMVFPMKNFISWFNVPDSVNVPPNFAFAFNVNFSASSFIVRSFGNIKLRAQVLTSGAASNISYPRIGIPVQEYTAEATANMNEMLLSSFIDFSYFEGKNIPPSNSIVPIGSSTWISQLTIASTKPVAYVIWPSIPNVANGIVNGRENFPNSPFDGLYFTKISLNIGGYEVVLLDRQISTNNFRFITRDSIDYFQNNINNSFMDLSARYAFASKALLVGIPLYFVVDPSKFINHERIGPPVGPITSQITCTFQEYLPTTKTLGVTTQQYQMNVYEIVHSQCVIDPTLNLTLVTPGAKLDGTAPRATQSLVASALSR